MDSVAKKTQVSFVFAYRDRECVSTFQRNWLSKMQNYMVMFEHKKQNEKRAAKSEESNLTKSQTERKENGY